MVQLKAFSDWYFHSYVKVKNHLRIFPGWKLEKLRIPLRLAWKIMILIKKKTRVFKICIWISVTKEKTTVCKSVTWFKSYNFLWYRRIQAFYLKHSVYCIFCSILSRGRGGGDQISLSRKLPDTPPNLVLIVWTVG